MIPYDAPNTQLFKPDRPGTAGALNYIGNHDIKSAVYITLVEENESKAGDLAAVIEDHTNPGIFTRDLLKGYLRTFKNGEFATMRVGSNSGFGPNPAYYYTAKRQDEALPPLDAVVGWSESHNHSLIPVLSSTCSSGSSQAPFNSIQIFDGLLNGMTSVGEFATGHTLKTHKWHSGYGSRLQSLVESGLVTIDEDPNEFCILDPIYKGSLPFEKLRPEKKAVHQVLEAAHEVAPGEKWTMASLIALGDDLELLNHIPGSNFRAVLTKLVSVNSPTFPGVVTKLTLEPRHYAIAPHFTEAAHDLVERVRIIDSAGDKTRSRAANRVLECYRDSTIASRIVRRGIANSPYIRKSVPASVA